MEFTILKDLVVVLGLSVVVIFFFHRFRIPTILGFLMTGILAGPSILSLINYDHEVEMMAEIGVILLLFVIGMELSLKTLTAIRKAVFVGGAIQVLLTIAIVFGLAQLIGLSQVQAIFAGFTISLSSTAIVLKILQERGEISATQGRTAVAVLIFQDIIVVPMMLVTPLLAGEGGDIWTELGWMMLKAIMLLALVLISAKYVVPFLLDQIAKTRINELFLLTTVTLCFAIAWLSYSLGLSLALGAFLAGLIISETDYHYQATSYILPFHEIFTSIFFVSVGMLLDLQFLFDNFLVIFLLTLAVLTVKNLTAMASGLILKLPFHVSLLLGFSLSQIGEFSFILAKTGMDYNLIDEDIYQTILAISIITMAITPFSISYSHRFSRQLKKLKKPEQDTLEEVQQDQLKDHIVIIGYGLNGKNVSLAAKNAGIPYVIMELNHETVKQEKKKGEPILFGDAASGTNLSQVKIHNARVAVIAISDPRATKRIVSNIKSMSPHTFVIVRTRFVQEITELRKIGADEVIPEEFETSIEIFHRVLNHYLVPVDEIDHFSKSIREGNYEMLLSKDQGRKSHSMAGVNLEIATIAINKEPNEVIGKKISDSDIRKKYQVNVVALKRDSELLTNIDGDTILQQDDIVYILGAPDAVKVFGEKLRF